MISELSKIIENYFFDVVSATYGQMSNLFYEESFDIIFI